MELSASGVCRNCILHGPESNRLNNQHFPIKKKRKNPDSVHFLFWSVRTSTETPTRPSNGPMDDQNKLQLTSCEQRTGQEPFRAVAKQRAGSFPTPPSCCFVLSYCPMKTPPDESTTNQLFIYFFSFTQKECGGRLGGGQPRPLLSLSVTTHVVPTSVVEPTTWSLPAPLWAAV